MLVLRSPSSKSSDPVDEAGEDAAARFHIALRELRDLRRQLHHAADHCEAGYKRTTAQQKRTVVENTRKYICSAVVTVVDHLGSVAASVEGRLLGSAELAETEGRIDSLKQRLLTCRQYAVSIDLAALRWNPDLPRHRPHYIIIPAGQDDENSNGDMSQREITLPSTSESPSNDGYRTSPSNRSILSTDHMDSMPLNGESVSEPGLFFTQIFGSTSVTSTPRNPSGHRTEVTRRCDERRKKLVQGSNFLSFFRRSRRSA